ncbi:pantothenate kinase [Trichocoleus sp. DQ-U1]|uniref:pantothenate kinase n=1 Tax=Trichocoleus sp. DQ-U1 TaxID=2933926 RepID=UPI003296F320
MKLRENFWIALMVGNSRLHWAWFKGKTFCDAWDTQYLPASVVEQLNQPWGGGEWRQILPSSLIRQLEAVQKEVGDGFGYRDRALPIYLASVVPEQTALWQCYPDIRVITLEQLPLQGLYPTLGIDRALAVLGAAEVWGFPVLVIDAGTALTFTSADVNHRLVGGAILPGLRLQLQSLTQRTAALPPIELPQEMPPRFAVNTPEAIQSGVIYTVLAGIRDFIQAWWQKFPGSRVILTGGDRATLFAYLQIQFPEIASQIISDPNLIFMGMRSVVLSS